MKSNPVFFLGIIAIVLLFAALLMIPTKSEGNESTTLEEIGPADVTPENATLDPIISDTYKINISVDKYTYYPRDVVEIEIEIIAPEERDEALIQAFGVENKYGAYKLKKMIDSDLDVGENVFQLKASIPSCSSCSGIVVPGVFQVYVAVYDEDEVMIVNASTEIEIVEE